MNTQWLLTRRFFCPPVKVITNFGLFVYFTFVICIMGALGAWIPAGGSYFGISDVDEFYIYRNFATYVIAIVATTHADYLIRTDNNDDGATKLFLFAIAVIAAIAAISVLLVSNLELVKKFFYFGAILAAYSWMATKYNHPDFTNRDSTQQAYSALGTENP